MLTKRLAIVLAASTLAGCAFFAALTGNDQAAQEQAQADAEAEQRRQAEEAARAQEQADLEFAAKLEPLRTAANAEGATLEQVIEFVDEVVIAVQSGVITRGKVPASVVDEARADLDKQLAAVAKAKDPDSVSARALVHIEIGRAHV